MITSMDEYYYADDQIYEILYKIKLGTEIFREFLLELQNIYQNYHSRVQFHLIFSNVVLPFIGIILMLFIIVDLKLHKKKQ